MKINCVNMKSYVIGCFILLVTIMWEKKSIASPGSISFKKTSQQQDTAYHIDANFVAKGFGYEPTISSMKKKYASKLKEEKKAVTNPYDSKIKDTIVTLSGQGMKFIFYKQIKNTTLTEASITSPAPILQKGIKIGLTKNQVMKKIPEMAMAMVVADLWQIGNEERTQYFELSFKNNILKTIKYFNPSD